jgi:Protein of unknown function (DUF2442)
MASTVELKRAGYAQSWFSSLVGRFGVGPKTFFSSLLEGVVDMRRLIFSPEAGVFAALGDAALFGQVYVEFGAVTWPGEIDLAPDAMHRQIEAAGSWTP